MVSEYKMAKKKKTKFKKELSKTLHNTKKNKSNKLIYAVGGGLALILIIFILVTIGGDKQPVEKEKLMLDTVSYLKRASGITDIKIIKEENQLTIFYDKQALIDNNRDMDFKKIARYAGILLSNKLGNEEVKVVLSDIDKNEKDYLIKVKEGAVSGEQQLN